MEEESQARKSSLFQGPPNLNESKSLIEEVSWEGHQRLRMEEESQARKSSFFQGPPNLNENLLLKRSLGKDTSDEEWKKNHKRESRLFSKFHLI